MRGLKRNKQKMWYQLYSEHIPVYETDRVFAWGITAALGMAVTIREINRLLKYMGGNYHEINYGTADKTI